MSPLMPAQAHKRADESPCLEAVLSVGNAPPAKDKGKKCSAEEEAQNSVNVKGCRFSDTRHACDVVKNK